MKTKFPKSVQNVLQAQYFDNEYDIICDNWHHYADRSFNEMSIDELIEESEYVLFCYYENHEEVM
jgi:hypothetical protein